jgi:hypothetical protein
MHSIAAIAFALVVPGTATAARPVTVCHNVTHACGSRQASAVAITAPHASSVASEEPQGAAVKPPSRRAIKILGVVILVIAVIAGLAGG